MKRTITLTVNGVASSVDVEPRTLLVHVLRDEPDNRILECALAGRAKLIVTGDREMLALTVWEGMRVVSLREFLAILAAGLDA